ncbi:MAG: hypothetical protein ACI4S9_07700 [Christensenellales bacterium]
MRGFPLKIAINPLFWVLITIVICSRAYALFAVCALAFFVHEAGHIFFARNRGGFSKLSFSLSGAKLSSGSGNAGRSLCVIAGGVVFNVLAALISTAAGMLFPAAKTAFAIAKVNLVFAFYNLLPAYPLDGARIVLHFSENKVRTLMTLKRTGALIAIVFLLMFLLSLFLKPNPTFLFVSAFLGLNSAKGIDGELYDYVENKLADGGLRKDKTV